MKQIIITVHQRTDAVSSMNEDREEALILMRAVESMVPGFKVTAKVKQGEYEVDVP